MIFLHNLCNPLLNKHLKSQNIQPPLEHYTSNPIWKIKVKVQSISLKCSNTKMVTARKLKF